MPNRSHSSQSPAGEVPVADVEILSASAIKLSTMSDEPNSQRPSPAQELVKAGGGQMPGETGRVRYEPRWRTRWWGVKKQLPTGEAPRRRRRGSWTTLRVRGDGGGVDAERGRRCWRTARRTLVRSYRLSFQETVGPTTMDAVSELVGRKVLHVSQPDRVRSAANVRDLRARASGPRSGGRQLEQADAARLFVRWQTERDQAAREELVRRYLPLARGLAARYARTQEPFEDLFQVASLGLVKAIDRFDLERGFAFKSFAVPTIVGELNATSATRAGRSTFHAGCRSSR